MSRYRLTPEAAKDLDEIANFIAPDYPAASIRLINQIQAKCQKLADMPGIGHPREELAPNLRSSLVGKYLIFYRPDEEGIVVIRVIHGHRDLPRQFE
jgi:toxin ParE1/3/4